MVTCPVAGAGGWCGLHGNLSGTERGVWEAWGVEGRHQCQEMYFRGRALAGPLPRQPVDSQGLLRAGVSQREGVGLDQPLEHTLNALELEAPLS